MASENPSLTVAIPLYPERFLMLQISQVCRAIHEICINLRSTTNKLKFNVRWQKILYVRYVMQVCRKNNFVGTQL